MYVDKCHKCIDAKTKAHTGQVTVTKTDKGIPHI